MITAELSSVEATELPAVLLLRLKPANKADEKTLRKIHDSLHGYNILHTYPEGEKCLSLMFKPNEKQTHKKAQKASPAGHAKRR